MSEYQYYEFQAVDRALTKDEMGEVRALSSRAQITPTRFTNVYHYGDFKGDPGALMERYYDGHVYVANWGTHRCLLRLPAAALDPETVKRYAGTEAITSRVTPTHLVLEFASDAEDGSWHEEEEDAEWLPSLLPIRAELEQGDLRALYLAWLSGADPELDDEAVEPPIPPGLAKSSAAQQALAEFLRIDADLLAAAAARSDAAPPAGPDLAELESWIAGLAETDKTALLLQVGTGNARQASAELLRRFRQETVPRPTVESAGGRTVGDLFAAAGELADARRRRDAERAARERSRFLDDLAARHDAA